jgi:glutamate--cysteine ligase
MTRLSHRLHSLSDTQLAAMSRGIEKESLRVLPSGSLALTPHPTRLGSALTHAQITTDYSESQLELITGVHRTPESCLGELTHIHQSVLQHLGDEMLWVSSMPCGLPTDETIPIGRYGSSNIGRAKSVYRMGLGFRYGRRMQTISGIHYNWSLPGLSTNDYFSLIRNFRRQVFVLMILTGASPAVCKTFVAGRQHGLQPLGDTGTLALPYATSLRMGNLGYQSDAQAGIAASFNSLESYGASLQEALTRPYPAYEQVGIRNPGGDYNQLATSLLQIENEYYGTIRPKRVIAIGERPLHALRERGVEYIEVRCLDLNPFLTVGIDAPTTRLIDLLLLHCLLSDSPPDSVDDLAELAHNQQAVASQGRDPALQLQRAGQSVNAFAWGMEILDRCRPIAHRVDSALGGQAYNEALTLMQSRLAQPEKLPSAQVLASMASDHHNSHNRFVKAHSVQTRQALLALPYSAAQREAHEKAVAESLAAQQAIEQSDTLSFEAFRAHYVDPARLAV